MNEHKEFDKYIKGFFDKNPAAPSELAWEKMEIDLPNTQKRNYWKYFALLLLLLWGTSMVYFIGQEGQVQVQENQSQENKSHKNQAQVQNEEALKFIETDKQNHQKITKTSHSSNQEIKKIMMNTQFLQIKPVPQSILKNTNNLSIKAKTPNTLLVNENIHYTNKPKPKKEVQQKQVVPIEKPIQNSVTNFAKINNPTNSISPIIKQTEKAAIIQSIEKLPIICMKRLPKVFEQSIFSLQKPLLLLKNEDDDDEDYEKEKLKIKEIFLGYGNNRFALKIDESNILKNKLTEAPGKSFTAGVRFAFNSKWNGKLSLKYNEYRTLFNHNRDLKPIYESNFKINRTEVTRHTNFTKTVDLQLGIERRWKLLKKLEFYSGIGIAPTYIQLIDGKTTDGVLVSRLQPIVGDSKFSVSGGISFGMSYAINRSLNAELAYRYNQFFVNGVFINHDILAKQQRSLSFLLSYKFK